MDLRELPAAPRPAQADQAKADGHEAERCRSGVIVFAPEWALFAVRPILRLQPTPEASVLCPAVPDVHREPPVRIAGPPDGIRTPPCSLDAVGRQGDQTAHLIRRGKPSEPARKFRNWLSWWSFPSNCAVCRAARHYPVTGARRAAGFQSQLFCASHPLDSKASAPSARPESYHRQATLWCGTPIKNRSGVRHCGGRGARPQ
jgi:hypothetical protein